jgi:hypothetical protein
MANSDSWKPGARPDSNTSPAGSAAASSNPTPTPTAADASAGKAAGRVVHDERGNAVWDWLKDTARIAIDSTSRLLLRLEVPELKMEDTQEQEARKESDRDAGGGYDPYGGSGSTPSRTSGRQGPGNSDGARGASKSTASHAGAHGNLSNNAGGGYDPYGKSVTTKPIRKP